MCAIYAIKINKLIIRFVICCYNVVICCYKLGDFPIDAFFAICNLRAQKVLYSAKKLYNAEVVFPDVYWWWPSSSDGARACGGVVYL